MANEQIQRYHCIQDRIDGQMNPQDDGNWILYTDHLAAITDLREGQMHLAMELERKDEQIRKLREALKDLRIRYVGIFDGYVRKTYHERSNPDDDLLLSLFDTDAALKEGK